MNKEALLDHYDSVEDEARQRLDEFSNVATDDRALFEELTFCVFAANSSAEMALKAVDLLDPVLLTGDVETYQEVLSGEVRFYNVRSEYTAYNYKVLRDWDESFATVLDEARKPRMFVKEAFKGIGMKEASHFLRNTGHSGYCILDKHVREVCASIGVLDDASRPRSAEEYLGMEEAIKAFCEREGLDVDVFDLAVWSWKTGRILK